MKNRLVINADYKGIEDEYALPAVESEIEKIYFQCYELPCGRRRTVRA